MSSAIATATVALTRCMDFLQTIEVCGRCVSWACCCTWGHAPGRYDRFRLQLKYAPDSQTDFSRGKFFRFRASNIHRCASFLTAVFASLVAITMKGKKRRTCLNLVVDLFSILRVARSWNYQVPIIKLESVRLPVDDQDKVQAFFTPSEVRSILVYFEGRRPWDTFFLLLACTGLRASEILGLRVCDLDFSRRQIHIRQSCWHGKSRPSKPKAARSLFQ